MSNPTGGHPAFRCEVCHGEPMWRLDRRGDAVVSWGCPAHVSEVLDRLQRDWEITQIVVKHVAKMRERGGISQTLAAVTNPWEANRDA